MSIPNSTSPEQPVAPIDWKVESQRFDGVAGDYNTYRPSYPDDLINDIVRISGIRPDSDLLEIGSGTGKATILFARRGFGIQCLEPGQNLIDVAAQNLAAYPRVRFVRARFEEWEPGAAAFDLVFSAQAYHWVPEEVRYPLTARALKPGGWLAAFWNLYPGVEGEVWRELDQVYHEHAPEIATRPQPAEEVIASRTTSLQESPYFENVIVRRYPWTVQYTTKEYLGLLNTYSDHLRLPQPRRGAFFEKIGAVIDRHGGCIDKPYLAAVFMAQKK